MDVPRDAFPFHLANILHDLTTCSFVAMDLELSGIPAHSSGAPYTGMQTLQERYAQTKEAAERYQVLQIGLTIAHEDVATAIEFLMANKFRLQTPFEEGVYYISRDEEKRAMAKALQRQDRAVERSLIDVRESDTESLEFLGTVRRAIDAWLAKGKRADDYLNIPPPAREKKVRGSNPPLTVLNRFQKRLVHQLVQSEYPSLVTIGKPGFVQIIRYDEVREEAVKMERMRRTEERILRQTGFRWIAEALTGGDLSKLDPKTFSHLVVDLKGMKKEKAVEEFAESIKQRLKVRRPTLVGHNLFLDLINFCQCFFGNLPERVEDFQDMVHEMFPILIDTKYMATHECGSIIPSSSLAEINDALKEKTKPEIVVDPQHSKYESQELFHEAGYDSMLTAKVFIKLSAQLCQEDSGVEVDKHKPTSIKAIDTHEGLHPEISKTPGRKGEKVQEHLEPPRQEPAKIPKAETRFAHRTKFDLLTDTVETVDSDETEIGRSSDLSSTEEDGDIAQKIKNGELIPRFGSAFWNVYGNKLRVFGTEERVCVLGSTAGPKKTPAR
ncbi:CAF1 family ribonuclease [Rasamsonia emersonii CBS 393.64]|uniref:CAF1 family ribonuclease n=1 Tax=Rasamsonia emersonii (strain ATCC 16479 / CBS 393.64 / IMI 116815) TaxID=1408163 RepID=A0A0F4YVY1_RASE3|nr:CAF1 family ribonuclease [Rasamsonia emersonii CBS 393.64]KKA22245.1 CAF1 family ribonuclease [Rasamsonia emersonii CBS 393.64]